jgi:hypothetical protein
MQNVTKEQVAEAVIRHIKNNNKNIEVKTRLIRDYEDPQKVIWKSNHSGYTPDIKTTSPKGNSDIYEIELTDHYNADKWHLFSLYTKKTQGNLILVIPDSRVDEVSKEIRVKRLRNIQLITIPL